MKDDDDEKDVAREKSHRRAARDRGKAAWRVEKRSTVLICRECDARIPLWKKPSFCPECGAGQADGD